MGNITNKAPLNLEPFPAELKALPQWVVWRFETRKGKPTKVLHNPITKQKASSTNPETWTTLQQALALLEGFDGPGFVFTPSDPYCGIDLDWKPYKGEGIPLEAQTIIDRLNSYTELSPSGRGCHIFIKGNLPPGGNRKRITETLEVEMYESGRYFTVTGQHLDGTPLTVEVRQEEIEKLHTDMFPPKPAIPPPPKPAEPLSLSDSELLERIFKSKNGGRVKKLWEGDWKGAGHGSQSEADLSLCSSLYFWAQGDTARVDSLFRRSGLMRDKWDERHYSDGRTYGQATLERCLGGEVYTPKAKRKTKVQITPQIVGARKTEGQPDGVTPLEYRATNGYIERLKGYEAGKPVFTPLCNFKAQIVAQVSKDDGVETERTFLLEGTHASGEPLPVVNVPANRFPGMAWVLEHWGANAIVEPGNGVKERLAVGIQKLSGSIPSRVTYAHLGWRKIGGVWHYLHAGGAIGPDGASPNIEVSTPGGLDKYCLPQPNKGDGLKKAVRASLGITDLGPDTLTLSLFCGLYRSVLDKSDFTLYLVGLTGVYKTELAALAQQHFGVEMNAKSLPGSWGSTGNQLEGLAFAAKDALLVVDDFAPEGSRQDIDRFHKEAARVLRAQGNNAGRGRARHDGTPRPAKPPRGTILSTGEDIPRGHSVRARALVLEVRRGDIPSDKLTVAQDHASEGVYAQALAAYLQWLAPRLERARNDHKARVREYRREFQAAHNRTVDIAAELISSLHQWLEFALEVEAISNLEAQNLWERAWTSLTAIASAQGEHQASQDPVERFAALVAGVLVSGKAHLVSALDGKEPDEPTRWGWTAEVQDSDQWGQSTIYKSRGARIGWLPQNWKQVGIYLEPESAYATVQELARSQGDSLSMSSTILWKRLAERQYLQTEEGHNKVKRTVDGQRPRVIHLLPSYMQKIGAFGAGEENAVPDANTSAPKSGRAPKIPELKIGAQSKSTSSDAAQALVQSPQENPAPKISPENNRGATINEAQENAVLNGVSEACPESPEKLTRAPLETAVSGAVLKKWADDDLEGVSQ